MLSRDVVQERAIELFAPNNSFAWPKQMRAFNCTNPPPEVIISIFIPDTFNPKALPSNDLIHLCKDPFAGKSGVLLQRAKG